MTLPHLAIAPTGTQAGAHSSGGTKTGKPDLTKPKICTTASRMKSPYLEIQLRAQFCLSVDESRLTCNEGYNVPDNTSTVFAHSDPDIVVPDCYGTLGIFRQPFFLHWLRPEKRTAVGAGRTTGKRSTAHRRLIDERSG